MLIDESLFQESVDFIKKVDTLQKKTTSLELDLYRRIGPIFEEIWEYNHSYDEENKKEERYDVIFYLISLYNFLEDELFFTKKVFTDKISVPVFLGKMKKIVRKKGFLYHEDIEQDMINLMLDIKCNLTNAKTAFCIDKDFIPFMTEKLKKKFPEHIKEWGI